MASNKKAAPPDPSKPRPGLRITSRRESFRRFGRQFSRNEPVIVPLDEIDQAELERVEEEGELVIEKIEIPAEAPKAE